MVLQDDKHNFPAQNIVPFSVNFRKISESLRTVLNAVSAKATTAGLIGLNTAVSGDAAEDTTEAVQDWLRDNNLIS